MAVAAAAIQGSSVVLCGLRTALLWPLSDKLRKLYGMPMRRGQGFEPSKVSWEYALMPGAQRATRARTHKCKGTGRAYRHNHTACATTLQAFVSQRLRTARRRPVRSLRHKLVLSRRGTRHHSLLRTGCASCAVNSLSVCIHDPPNGGTSPDRPGDRRMPLRIV